jgi:LysM repeat protein
MLSLTIVQQVYGDGTASPNESVSSSESIKVHIIMKGDTLEMIASKYYGSNEFAKIIQAYNNIDDPRRLKVGQEIAVPDIKSIFTNLGLHEIAEEVIAPVLKARTDYSRISSQLMRYRMDYLRRHLTRPGPVRVIETPEKYKGPLHEAIHNIEKAMAGPVPPSMASQLSVLYWKLSYLERGKVSGGTRYGYDRAEIEQHFSYAIYYATLWAMNQSRKPGKKPADISGEYYYIHNIRYGEQSQIIEEKDKLILERLEDGSLKFEVSAISNYGHTCSMDGIAVPMKELYEYRETLEELSEIMELEEPLQCILQLKMHGDHVFISDIDNQCRLSYCGVRAKLDGLKFIRKITK